MTGTYTEATQKAIAALSSDHEGLFLCITRVDEDNRTNLEVISGVDSSVVKEGKGEIRLQQAAMHTQYLSDISGLTPMQIAIGIGKAIEDGEIEISKSVLKK